MRFFANGPSIPDGLLVARDLGDVIFFCGAGVSQGYAGLPDFVRLGRDVIRNLGSAQDSPARQLLDKAVELGKMASVGGLLATDRVFGLLEREFEIGEVRAAVAEAIRPPKDHRLDAHSILLDLAKSPSGVTRLVTTNFDLLFEACDPALVSFGPPQLPDPRSSRDFHGVVHLHGRVDASYSRPADDEFVISSADFGRAYLSDGWATRFIQSLMARYQIVFVGYSADDPPVQYLLEALNLPAGGQNRLFAFQDGESGEAAALWEHRGVQAISFDASAGFTPLWDTLNAWADRARDIDGWYSNLLEKACSKPATLDPHIRGQIAHLASTNEGARRIASSILPIHADWLLVFDARYRYASVDRIHRADESGEAINPYEKLHLDFDAAPASRPREEEHRPREIPEGTWNALSITRVDHQGVAESAAGNLCGEFADTARKLSPRLASLGVWIRRVAHMPTILWWAAQQHDLHPDIKNQISRSLEREHDRFPEEVRNGWRLLISAWADRRPDPDFQRYDIEARTKREGWTRGLVREYLALYRPQLKVKKRSDSGHPLFWSDNVPPEKIVIGDIAYPHPHAGLLIPDDFVAYAAALARGNLELAISLEMETSSVEHLYFETTRSPDEGPELAVESYGLTGPILMLQKLVGQWATKDSVAASTEVMRWPRSDEQIFARLCIWAAGQNWLPAGKASSIFNSLSDRVFWGSQHERDLLYALRDKWPDLSIKARASLEDRLRSGSFPWDADVRGGVEQAAARDRMSRIHWLSNSGVAFGFDVQAELQMLQAVALDWTTKVGDAAADSHAPAVYSVTTDDDDTALRDTPISEILAKSGEAGTSGFFGRVQREPFKGLSARRPIRALAALTHADRIGKAPPQAWSVFLSVQTRSGDSVRMIRLIARRLVRLPIMQFREMVYAVSEWMLAISSRLYTEAASELDPLWNRVIEALSLGGDRQPRRTPQSWGDAALNAPVGKLYDLLMNDPERPQKSAAGLPAHWMKKAEQLLGLPNEHRCHALVMFGYQVVWLYYVAPAWTERVLLTAADDESDEGDAFWDGALWAARNPFGALFKRLKAGLSARTYLISLRHSQGNVLAAFLLSGWLSDVNDPEEKLSDIELREILIHTNDQLRGQILWHLEQMLKSKDGKLRNRVVPFLKNVWPKQRSVRTPSHSAQLGNIALMAGDLTPEIVNIILPRLVPITGAPLRMELMMDNDDGPAKRHPKSVLDLLWATLAEDPRQWPYKVSDMLDELARDIETSGDPRLSELRRRRER